MRKELCLFGIYQQGNGGRERFFGIFFLVILGRLIFLVGAGTLCCGQDLYILEFRGLGGFPCVLIGCKEHDDVTSFHLAGTAFGKGGNGNGDRHFGTVQLGQVLVLSQRFRRKPAGVYICVFAKLYIGISAYYLVK